MKWLIALPRRGLKWLRNQVWPSWLYVRQLIRAAIQASGITITVLAAMYSIAIPYLLSEIKEGLVITPGLAAFLLIVALIVSVPLVLVSGWIALKAADPETYSRILIGGRPAKEVLFTISKRIDRACRRTLRLSTWAEDLLKKLETTFRPKGSKYRPKRLPSGRWRRWMDRRIRQVSLLVFRQWRLVRRSREPRLCDPGLLDVQLREEIECLVWWLRRFPQRQHTQLLRIETMKYQASGELDIPPRRICDHLFQYSPAMHRDRLQKYVQNWDLILDSRPIDEASKQRLWEIAVQNFSFLNNTRRRRRYQREILENRDLHGYIVQFASKHSTSGSLQTYAEALTSVAMLGRRRLERARGTRNRELRAALARLALLRRKQRAHPGFELHKLLLYALNGEECGRQESLLQVRRVLQGLDQVRLVSDRRSKALPLLSEVRLESFRDLPFWLGTQIASSRKKISREFKSRYGDWLSGRNESRYIVSHGYSRTVLSVLRSCLPAPGEDSDELLPRLFFLLPDEKNDKESFDTRVMEYELKEDRVFRSFRNLAAGNEKHLLALLKESDRVLILLGAECFDKERRMVHPRGFRPLLSTILDELRGRGCQVVVVAESYKRHQGLLTEDTQFYGQHFDRIDLYPPELIHCVITDKETLVRTEPS